MKTSKGHIFKSKLQRGPYLQLATSNSIVIVWRTLGETHPVVRFGDKPGHLDHRVANDNIHVMDKLEAGVGEAFRSDGLFQYEAHVSGLRPQTVYYYSVYDEERLLAGGDSYCFRTYPRIGEPAPVQFIVFGDPHESSWHQKQVYRIIQEFPFIAKSGDIDFWLDAGDIAGARGRDIEFQYVTFEPYAVSLRNTVMWPTPGNHDILTLEGLRVIAPYADAFVVPTQGEAGGVPSDTEAYYSFDYGRVHLVSLSSFFVDRRPNAPMARWLVKDIEKTRADGKTDWLIVFFHSPPYSKSANSDSDKDMVQMRSFIMPILEQEGVDLIFSGHSHSYERSMLLDGAYATPTVAEGVVLDDGDGDPNGDGAYRKSAGLNPHEGTVAVVCGNGGAVLVQLGTHPVMKKTLVEYGFVLVDVKDEVLTCRMVNEHGVVRDTFSIVKREKVCPRRIANPRKLPPTSCRHKLPGTRFALVPVVEEKVIIDGKIEEEAWRKGLSTEFKGIRAILFASADALYLAFTWSGSHDAIETRHDGYVFADDFIQLWVDPVGDRKSCYRFAFNCNGVTYDSRNGDVSYNPEWEVRTQTHQKDWRSEVRIPWKSLGMAGLPDTDTWVGMDMNASRYDAQWARSRARADGDPAVELFTMVKFGPGRVESLIPPSAEWSYLAGRHPEGGWTKADFNAKDWKVGPSGFGYGDIENSTTLVDMKGLYSSVYLRRTFEIEDVSKISDLVLIITYDDAFIAYLNGEEVLRVGVESGSGDGVKSIAIHEGTGPEYSWERHLEIVRSGVLVSPFEGLPVNPEYFSLRRYIHLLRTGTNVLAIEGHNAGSSSKAFTIDPHLLVTCRE